MNNRKPKVVIPGPFAAFMAVAISVRESIAGHANARLLAKHDPLDVAIDEAQTHDQQRLSSSEASQASREVRDSALANLKNAFRQARDMALSIDPLNPSVAGRFGFTVIQSGTAGTLRRARVLFPTNIDAFLSGLRRVIDAVDDLAAAGDPVAVDMKVVLDAVAADANSAETSNNEFRTSYEAAQRSRVLRDRQCAIIRNTLASIRDIGFGLFGPGNYEEVSTLGFEVQSDATQNQTSGPAVGSGGNARVSTFGNIQGSDCNVNGVVNVACIGNEFGIPSEEYTAVSDTDEDGNGSVQILDVAVTLGLVDPRIGNTDAAGNGPSGFISP